MSFFDPDPRDRHGYPAAEQKPKKRRGQLGEIIDLLIESGLNIPDEVRNANDLVIAIRSNPKRPREDEFSVDEFADTGDRIEPQTRRIF
jgi:hypothetical protein